MGLADMISNKLKSNSKSLVSQSKEKPSITNKNTKYKPSLLKDMTVSLRRNYTPAKDKLPDWSKGHEHLVKIRIISSDPTKSKVYPGYIYIRDNKWVEYHCFDNIFYDTKHVCMRKEWQDVTHASTLDTSDRNAGITSSVTRFRTVPEFREVDGYDLKTPSFGQIKISGVTARENIGYVELHPVFADMGVNGLLEYELQIQFNSEDVARWKKWHPKNNFKRSFPELARGW